MIAILMSNASLSYRYVMLSITITLVVVVVSFTAIANASGMSIDGGLSSFDQGDSGGSERRTSMLRVQFPSSPVKLERSE
eukprot:3458689-Amphidinium_carterae.1